MRGFSHAAASVIGREHIRLWGNNQDSHIVGETDTPNGPYLYGVICDGCSEGRHSEVGANLVATFLGNEIGLLLSSGSQLSELPQVLFERCLSYLRSVVTLTVGANPVRVVDYVTNHLLATAIGVVLGENEGVVFNAGDGVVVINDSCFPIQQDNRPTYLAYHLVPRECLVAAASAIPTKFEVRTLEPVSAVNQLIIASDGLEEDLVGMVAAAAISDIKLKRELKRLSLREGRLADDCTVIALTRIPEGGETD